MEDNKYFLYRHIRIDKNEPFYIGIGTVSEKDKLSDKPYIYYRRAYATRGRNVLWKDISTKGYTVEIVLESDNKQFIKDKEREFIKLYGRIDLKEGILSNMTNGGDGMKGVINFKGKRVYNEITGVIYNSVVECSKVTGISENILYKELSGTTVSKHNLIPLDFKLQNKTSKNLKQDRRVKKVINLKTLEIFSCIQKACDSIGMDQRMMSKKINNYQFNNTDFQFLEDYEKGIPKNKPRKERHFNRIKVIDNSTGEIYPSITDAAKAKGISKSTLHTYLRKGNNPTTFSIYQPKT